jgi:4-amino-4-deoxy-L-arabinose transferase-like glycosyltransferase
MSRTDQLAVLLSLLAIFLAALVTQHIFEGIPHLEDEVAYVWQARLLAEGKLSIPSPSHPRSFLVPFVVDYEGLRFGKYPPGWPLVLSVGVLLGARSLVNPLLAGLGVWLTYVLGKRLFGQVTGLLAAGLTLTSPFFLINSGSLLSHPLGLVLSAAFALLWLAGFGQREIPPRWRYTLGAALVLGFLILTRPFTAVGIALPFAAHGLYIFFFPGSSPEQRRQTRVHLLAFGGLALALAALIFLWQYRLTGDPFLNPYTLWWEYDRIGFGEGIGVVPGGHRPEIARINMRFSLNAGWRDLFGWAGYSWLFLPFGLLAALKNWRGLLVGAVFPSLVFIHIFYWIGSELFGPRYYYEGLYSLTLFTALGVAWLAGWLKNPGAEAAESDPPPQVAPALPLTRQAGRLSRLRDLARRTLLSASSRAVRLFDHPKVLLARNILVPALLILLVYYNLFNFLPDRLWEMHGLYTISRADLQPFQTQEAQALTPALIVVHSEKWMSYGSLIELEDPRLTTPFIFAWSRGPDADQALVADFPERNIYHYYVDEPGAFYTAPKPP